MKDWNAIAQGNELPLAGKDLDRLIQPLAALEKIFRPLTKDLPPELEPSVEFQVEADLE